MAHFLELKREKGVLSDDQVLLADFCIQNGYPYRVANNFQEAVGILVSWGAVRSMKT
jgi:hypothetical protein